MPEICHNPPGPLSYPFRRVCARRAALAVLFCRALLLAFFICQMLCDILLAFPISSSLTDDLSIRSPGLPEAGMGSCMGICFDMHYLLPVRFCFVRTALFWLSEGDFVHFAPCCPFSSILPFLRRLLC